MEKKLINELKNKSVFIFDFDGTIADTEHLNELAFKKVYEEFTGNKYTNGMHKKLMGKSSKECYYQFVEWTGSTKSFEETSKDFLQAFFDVIKTEKIYKYKFINKLLKVCKNGKCYIFSNQVKPILDLMLEKWKIKDKFEEVLSTNSTGYSKEELYKNTKKYLGANQCECVVFEDNAMYIDEAKKCGILTVGIEHDYNKDEIKPDFLIKL